MSGLSVGRTQLGETAAALVAASVLLVVAGAAGAAPGTSSGPAGAPSPEAPSDPADGDSGPSEAPYEDGAAPDPAPGQDPGDGAGSPDTGAPEADPSPGAPRPAADPPDEEDSGGPGDPVPRPGGPSAPEAGGAGEDGLHAATMARVDVDRGPQPDDPCEAASLAVAYADVDGLYLMQPRFKVEDPMEEPQRFEVEDPLAEASATCMTHDPHDVSGDGGPRLPGSAPAGDGSPWSPPRAPDGRVGMAAGDPGPDREEPADRVHDVGIDSAELARPPGGWIEPRTAAMLAAALALPAAAVVLYRRLTRDDVLENETRREVRDVVVDQPGITAGEVSEEIDAHYRTARHHLDVLVEFDELEAKEIGSRTRYFENHQRFGRIAKRVVSCLGSETKREILMEVARSGAVRSGEVADRVDVAPSTASHHLSDLEEHGLVSGRREGRSVLYGLEEGVLPALLELAPGPRNGGSG